MARGKKRALLQQGEGSAKRHRAQKHWGLKRRAETELQEHQDRPGKRTKGGDQREDLEVMRGPPSPPGELELQRASLGRERESAGRGLSSHLSLELETNAYVPCVVYTRGPPDLECDYCHGVELI